MFAERLGALRNAIIAPVPRELGQFASRALHGEIPELRIGGRMPSAVDLYGRTARVFIPWGEGLEKSYLVTYGHSGKITLRCEGFFPRS